MLCYAMRVSLWPTFNSAELSFLLKYSVLVIKVTTFKYQVKRKKNVQQKFWGQIEQPS